MEISPATSLFFLYLLILRFFSQEANLANCWAHANHPNGNPASFHSQIDSNRKMSEVRV
jgi:hypothetical protein